MWCEYTVHKYYYEKKTLEVTDELVKYFDGNDDDFSGQNSDSEVGRVRKKK